MKPINKYLHQANIRQLQKKKNLHRTNRCLMQLRNLI